MDILGDRVPNDRPIFVVGSPRSGTTMLQLMLHAHPRIAIPPETRFLLAGYKRRGEWGDLREAPNRERLAAWITRGKGTNFRDLDLDPDAVAAEIVAGPPTLGSAIGIVFRAYARKFDKPRWGDKRPAYLLNIGKLLHMFPDAQIINIIRDGRDCVASLKEQPWHRGGINEAISTWCRGSDAGRRALRTLPPDTYHQVYYESLVQDPVGQMTAICDFLGEEYHADMAGPSTMAAVAVPKRKVWHELTHGDVTTQRVGSFVERLGREDLALCQSVMRRRLLQHGYQLVDAGRPTWAQVRSYLPQRARTVAARAKRALRARRRRIRRRPPQPIEDVAARLTSAQCAGRSPTYADRSPTYAGQPPEYVGKSPEYAGTPPESLVNR
jgi:Sulfotransferase family